jgi:hypothetical protein
MAKNAFAPRSVGSHVGGLKAVRINTAAPFP